MRRREFLMLANKYTNQPIGGWLVSEKLDGQRCFWDGGHTRGTPKHQVPWANHDKDSRLLTRPVCTGLWSRYGNVIQAPSWWLDQLPYGQCLDGELMASDRQELRSIVSRQVAGVGWERVSYHVFASPQLGDILKDGVIKNVNYKKVFDGYAAGMARGGKYTVWGGNGADIVHVVPQQVLPMTDATSVVSRLLDEVSTRGGEGLMLRHPWWPYETKRSHNLLKVKKLDDDEGTVIGHTAGKGRLVGMMGALVLMLDNGCTMELSGFTDEERRDGTSLFPVGMRVTFRYRGKSRDGIPQEARYWRAADV